MLLHPQIWTFDDTYTRTQAISNNDLVDISKAATKAGLYYHTGIMRELHTQIVSSCFKEVGHSDELRLRYFLRQCAMHLKKKFKSNFNEVVLPVHITFTYLNQVNVLINFSREHFDKHNQVPCFTIQFHIK